MIYAYIYIDIDRVVKHLLWKFGGDGDGWWRFLFIIIIIFIFKILDANSTSHSRLELCLFCWGQRDLVRVSSFG